MSIVRKPYPSDVSDAEWALIAPYLTLLREEAGQREHSVKAGSTAYRRGGATSYQSAEA
jgi:hypothetical protein